MSEPGHQTPADESTIDLPAPGTDGTPEHPVEFGARTHVGKVRHNNGGPSPDRPPEQVAPGLAHRPAARQRAAGLG